MLSEAALERKRRLKKGHGVRGTSAWNDTLLRARVRPSSMPGAHGAGAAAAVSVGDRRRAHDRFVRRVHADGRDVCAVSRSDLESDSIAQLADPEIRERLRLLWTDPQALDPAKRGATVTREIAAKLAELAKSLKAKHDPHDVAFLMRCLFTMFARTWNCCIEELLSREQEMLEGLDDRRVRKPMARGLVAADELGRVLAHLEAEAERSSSTAGCSTILRRWR